MLNFLKKKQTFQKPNLPQVIIHIGSPKTGSSAIQKYMLENRKELLNLGIYYPEHGLDENGISGGHSNIGRRLIEGDINNAKNLFNEYLEQAKRKKCTLFLSAESYYIRAKEFDQLTRNIDYKIISFYRDPLESIYSNYNQGIKRNYATARLEPMCKNLAQKPADFYSGKMLEKWAELHGKDKLIVIEYTPIRFKTRSIQQTILEAIGFSTPVLKQHLSFDTNFINNSYTLAALEFKRMLNFILDQEQNKLNDQIDWYLQSLSDKTNSLTNSLSLKDRISVETYQLLSSAFSANTQFIKDELINVQYRLPQNTEIAAVSKKHLKIQNLNKQIYQILEQLKQGKPKIHDYIETQLEKKLKTSELPFEVLKLAELFDFDINQFEERNAWFNSNQLDKMVNFKEVDFCRDIANLCYQRGDINHAQVLIEKAKKARPNGPSIIKLHEKITKGSTP